MNVLVLRDVKEFAELAQPWMAADPFTTNVIGVNLAAAGNQAPREEDIWVVVVDGGEIVGVAMCTPPRNLFLPRLQAGIPSEIARTLAGLKVALPGVSGEVAAVSEFAQEWARQTGTGSRLSYALRMYRLGDGVVPPQGVEGEAHLAGQGDKTLLAKWFAQFHAEAMPKNPIDDADALVESRLLHYKTWLWCVRGTPVALAGCSPAAAGLARIGPVYTPQEHRRHGYGAAVTAYATQDALAGGATQVVLYTDLANPTSNAIYQGIGYVPDHDAEDRSFVTEPAPAAHRARAPDGNASHVS